MLAAKVCEYSLRARSKHTDEFDVRLICLESTPHLYPGREGRRYLWDGRVCVWHNRDLQAFGPLRLMVPQVMDFQGRALVLDPDIFAVGDVYELLQRDMNGKAILSRPRPSGLYSSAVMLLDCARLKHWDWNQIIDAVFAFKLDLYDCLRLAGENPDSIGPIEEEWNHLDTLNESTKLLHNTERMTQPWKTGLPIDFDLDQIGSYPYRKSFHAQDIVKSLKQRFYLWTTPSMGQYQPHPDRNQENFFIGLMREAMEAGFISEDFVASEIQRQHVRADILDLLHIASHTT